MEQRARRVRVRVRGTVQGVGFRPHVHGLANALDLRGFVGNDAGGVFLEVEGAHASVATFLDRLRTQAPPLAVIEDVDVRDLDPVGEDGFSIVASDGAGSRHTQVSPDVATCDDCLAEVFDPTDRRYRYAFTNCTNCGPRYTIVRDVPYDRSNTTMAGFAMCDDCAREYDDPTDRRFHAQPVCCSVCGPTLRLRRPDGTPIDGDPIERAAQLLRDGAVLAVKGLGGYHLAVDAGNEEAAATLRARKHREDKPFAVAVRDLDTARRLGEIGDHDARLLLDAARPIVLVTRRGGEAVAPSVAPGNRHLGLMLPYSPLHHLLLEAVGRPIVLTSGNRSDEPLAYRDEEAFERLGDLADAFLTHDRPIHERVDDSVVRVLAGRPVPIRRSRGYAPRPIGLPWRFPRPLLAVGAQLKNTVCLAKGRHAFVSQHLGDLENHATLEAFTHTIGHLEGLFDVTPQVVAHDLHPAYLSTQHALDLDGVVPVGIQHHHAHIASCLADNEHPGPVIGVAFDGTGYGPDGTIWGGEVLVADLASFERVGHLDLVPLPGGEAAIREPWRVGAAHLWAAYGDAVPPDLALRRRHADRWDDLRAVTTAGLNAPSTSSVGRLFDAIAALVGIRDAVNYEGQAAIELEQHADPVLDEAYAVAVRDEPVLAIAGADLVRAVVEDLRAGVPVAVIAARFHGGLVEAVVAACRHARDRHGLDTVALSGGVFQNRLLVERLTPRLTDAGFTVLTHRRVPPNDGGISLGQAVVAAARDRAGLVPDRD